MIQRTGRSRPQSFAHSSTALIHIHTCRLGFALVTFDQHAPPSSACLVLDGPSQQPGLGHVLVFCGADACWGGGAGHHSRKLLRCSASARHVQHLPDLDNWIFLLRSTLECMQGLLGLQLQVGWLKLPSVPMHSQLVMIPCGRTPWTGACRQRLISAPTTATRIIC